MVHSRHVKIIGFDVFWTSGAHWVLEVTQQKKEYAPNNAVQLNRKAPKQGPLIRRIVRAAFRILFLEISAIDGSNIGFKIRRYRKKSRYFIESADNPTKLTGIDVRRLIEGMYVQQEIQGRDPK